MGTSSAPGFLTEVSPPVPYDDDLIDALQPLVVGMLGNIEPTLVRPRWQSGDTPNIPAYTVNWVALGVSDVRHDTFPYERHVDEGEGHDTVQETEELDVLVSCYGPLAGGNAARLRSALSLGQNRGYLQDLGADLISVGNQNTLPALTTGVWVRRVDFKITLRRYIKRDYAVRTIVELTPPTIDVDTGQPAFGIDNEQYVTPLYIEKP